MYKICRVSNSFILRYEIWQVNSNISVQVSNLVEKASQALAIIGQYDPDDLPPEFKATINFVHKVSKLFGDIKADVMGFVNVSE